MLSQSIQSAPKLKPSVFLRLALLATFVMPAKGEAAPERVNNPVSYSITQNSRESNRNIVYVTKTAIKIRGLKNKLTVIAKAPDWTVYTFSEESKRICTVPLNNFTGGFRIALAITGEPVFLTVDFKKIGADKMNGAAVDCYKTTDAYADRAFKSYKKDEITGASPLVVQYAVANSLGVPKQAGWLLQRYYGLPIEDGVPLQLKYECCDHSVIKKITTDSVEPRQFGANEFQVPTQGYTKVNTVIEVLADHSKTTNADEIMSTFGRFAK